MNQALTTIAQVVVTIFGLFGGFLTDIVPWELKQFGFAHGFIGFISLCILIGIKFITTYVTNVRARSVALLIGFLIGAATFVYKGSDYLRTLDKWAFRYGGESGQLYLAGSELTDLGKSEVDRAGSELDSTDHLSLVFHFTIDPERDKGVIWTARSLEQIEDSLRLDYSITVLSIVLALGCGIEALYKRKRGSESA